MAYRFLSLAFLSLVLLRVVWAVHSPSGKLVETSPEQLVKFPPGKLAESSAQAESHTGELQERSPEGLVKLPPGKLAKSLQARLPPRKPAEFSPETNTYSGKLIRRSPEGLVKFPPGKLIERSPEALVKLPPGKLIERSPERLVKFPPGKLAETFPPELAKSPPGKLAERSPEIVVKFPPGKLVESISSARRPAKFPRRNTAQSNPSPGKLVKFPPGKLSPFESSLGEASNYCPVFVKDDAPARDCTKFPNLSDKVINLTTRSDKASPVLEDVFAALSNLQTNYFDAMNGTWPSSIDWTGAFVETIVSGTLSTLTLSLAASSVEGEKDDWKQKENMLSSVYAQVVHSFFGQNAVAIKDEAFDDMLWVVLGWIEAIKFVRLHAELHYPGTANDCQHMPDDLAKALETMPWQGYNFVCAFADRARTFWDLASNGWDTTLCHGGMLWNPRLAPYKNAITNELWISGSISMYQFFPNDTFNASWVQSKGFPATDPVYLEAGVEGYRWLKNVNMTNAMGLYVDGFHIDMSKPGNVECDVRDEMVYTYNQAVILTGQRGLWTLTGSPSYLAEGHALLRAAIAATGWDLVTNKAVDEVVDKQLPPWRGLGRGGILEDKCDVDGSCSQDAQAFKGIFMHHLTAFCAPVEPFEQTASIVIDNGALQSVQKAHEISCRSYASWIEHNAQAAMATRDERGVFGMWWGAGIFSSAGVAAGFQTQAQVNGDETGNVTDYRNYGTPQNEQWGMNGRFEPGKRSPPMGCMDAIRETGLENRTPSETGKTKREAKQEQKRADDDVNNRGRGRTIETQAGGLALLRAYYELMR